MTLLSKAPALLTSLWGCLAAVRCFYGSRFGAPDGGTEAFEAPDVGEQVALNRIGAMARERSRRI